MYNEEQKKRYIEYKTSITALPYNYLPLQFSYSEGYERELEKDISNFTVDEIENYYKSRLFTNRNSIASLNSQLSAYTQWCLQQGLVKDNQNHFSEIEFEDTSQYINSYVKDSKIMTRKMVLEFANRGPNPQDALQILLAFEIGNIKHKEDLCMGTYADFDKENLTYRLPSSGKKVKISQEVIDLVERCKDETTYYGYDKAGQSKKILERDLIQEGNYVVKTAARGAKTIYGASKERRRFRCQKMFIAYREAYGKETMVLNDIIVSGKIHFINTLAKEKGLSGVKYLEKYSAEAIEKIYKQYGYKLSIKAFIEDYERYLF